MKYLKIILVLIFIMLVSGCHKKIEKTANPFLENNIKQVYNAYQGPIPKEYLGIYYVSFYNVIYDKREHSQEFIEKAFKVCPNNMFSGYFRVLNSLQLCITSDKRYLPCFSRDINAPFFINNAETNQTINMELINEITNYEVDNKDLMKLKEHCLQGKKFEYWLQETCLNYFKTWDINVLKNKYNDELDPNKICPELIEKIAKTNDTNEKYKLVAYTYHNALNHVYRNSIPIDTKLTWENFLKENNIKMEPADLGNNCD